MTRFIKWLLFAFLLIVPFSAEAQVINAKSCSNTDVQNALNSVAIDGSTVVVPAGSCTWTSAVTYNQSFSTTIQGQSTVTWTCPIPPVVCTFTGTDSTAISLNTGNAALTVHTAAGKYFRMTGLTITSPSTGTAAYGTMNFNGGSTAFRIDHCHFNDQVNGDRWMGIDQVQGVIDHNFFDSSNSSNIFFMQPTNRGAGQFGNEVWAQPDNFGTSKFLFVENNVFQNGTFVYDDAFGGTLVFRFNTVGQTSRVQTHGTGSGPSRGGRAAEIYGNTFYFSANPNGNINGSTFFALVDLEAGTGLVWGNTVVGFKTLVREDVVRTNNATYPQNATPTGFGFCSSSPINGVPGPSAWDGNQSGQNGYPCLDNVGRGQGDPLTGGLPNLINSTTGTIAWPHQVLSPYYVWNNVFPSIPNLSTFYWQNFDSVTVENRDYYLQLPNINESATFNGTAGIGQGTLASKPSTCTAGPGGNTPGVGWWATDQGNWNTSGSGSQGQLFVCTATNTWSPYYTPYTYPHPLAIGSGTSGAPAPPKNLAASVQ